MRKKFDGKLFKLPLVNQNNTLYGVFRWEKLDESVTQPTQGSQLRSYWWKIKKKFMQ